LLRSLNFENEGAAMTLETAVFAVFLRCSPVVLAAAAKLRHVVFVK
jgi:hypothetical protein